ncbi:anti-anti-sigma factor [Streptacidiphilus sp. MAP12-16]|uniref:STAS domain-containing protein n=1 Tax=Streptacidiphilus sp. MAP12-16 TaxID=3156300 RepID=UPI0035141CD6
MSLHIRTLPGCVVVTLPPEVDLANIGQVTLCARDQLWDRLAELRAVVFDLTRTSFIGSEAGGLITETWHRGRQAGVPVCVAAPSPLHRRILQVLGLDRTALFRDMQQAVSGLHPMDNVG